MILLDGREPEFLGFKVGDTVRVSLEKGKVTNIEKLNPPVFENKRLASLGKMFRYQDTVYSAGNEDTGYSTRVSVNLDTFDIIKETLKGQWVQDEPRFLKPRFVLNHGRKRYAHHSKEEALLSFVARKRKQLRILKTQLRHVREALHYVGAKELD